ncbi:hypothetical protein AB1Y20_003498 [Prymnesium parvum]|uniref:G-patch domain-containing protein n=1 Tax=Prymnesium parvum TaxID=97485 RepID=A0AB34JBV3_PRYPA
MRAVVALLLVASLAAAFDSAVVGRTNPSDSEVEDPPDLQRRRGSKLGGSQVGRGARRIGAPARGRSKLHGRARAGRSAIPPPRTTARAPRAAEERDSHPPSPLPSSLSPSSPHASPLPPSSPHASPLPPSSSHASILSPRSTVERLEAAVLSFASGGAAEAALPLLSRADRSLVHMLAEHAGLRVTSRRGLTILSPQPEGDLLEQPWWVGVELEEGESEGEEGREEEGGEAGRRRRRRRVPREARGEPSCAAEAHAAAAGAAPLDTSNKGHQLLRKLGWSPGVGLGASGRADLGTLQLEIESKACPRQRLLRRRLAGSLHKEIFRHVFATMRNLPKRPRRLVVGRAMH